MSHERAFNHPTSVHYRGRPLPEAAGADPRQGAFAAFGLTYREALESVERWRYQSRKESVRRDR